MDSVKYGIAMRGGLLLMTDYDVRFCYCMNFLIFKIVFYPDLIYVSFLLLNYASIAK